MSASLEPLRETRRRSAVQTTAQRSTRRSGHDGLSSLGEMHSSLSEMQSSLSEMHSSLSEMHSSLSEMHPCKHLLEKGRTSDPLSSRPSTLPSTTCELTDPINARTVSRLAAHRMRPGVTL